jgi:hypothetical protein
MTLSKSEKKIGIILSNVLHEFAFELDSHYENEDIGVLADEDTTFLSFRAAVEALERRGVEVSKRLLHVPRRVEKSYEDAFEEPLPKLGKRGGSDKIFRSIG